MSAQAIVSPREVIYPESDGKPMAETDVHRQVMMDLIGALEERYRNDPLVYVSGNLLCYYEEGNPRASFSPDVFVVLGLAKHQRRVFKLWEEGVAPTMVIEVSSRSTKQEDLKTKRVRYAQLGVAEYFLFDPLEEYLRPSLQGLVLLGTDYTPLLPDATGRLMSAALGLHLVREGTNLALFDATTGARLPTLQQLAADHRAEASARRVAEERAAMLADAQQAEASARRVAEERAAMLADARQAEASARRVAEEQAASLAEEVARLRAELAQLKA